MILRPPISTRTDTLLPYTPLFRPLRSRATAERAPGRLGDIEGELEHALGRLVALQEAYPDLKANENFPQLQRDLVEVEEHLQYARRFSHGAVRDSTDAVQRVHDPRVASSSIFAGARSEVRRVGKACVSTCSSRWPPQHS